MILKVKHLAFPFPLALIFISVANGKVYRKTTFAIFSPKIIQPMTLHNLTVFTEDLKENIVARFEIKCDSAIYSVEDKDISGGKTELIGINVQEIPTETCFLNIKVKLKDAEWNSTEDLYNQTKILYTASKFLSILIQMDKQIYKPGETVKFRILILNRLLRPINVDSLEIKILDSQLNVIRLYKNESTSTGLFSDEMELSNEPNLGEWKISAKVKDEVKQISFSVVQYVIPKFKVQIQLPLFIINGTANILAEIKAMHSYGKKVNGQVTVQLQTLISKHYGYPNTYEGSIKTKENISRSVRSTKGMLAMGKIMQRFSQPKNPPRPALTTIKQITLPINGLIFVDLQIPNGMRTMTKVTERIFYVDVTVTENYTGIQENASGKVKMYPSPYKIEMMDTPKYYQPGFPLNFTFKITTLDGIPILDDQPDAFEVSHGFSYDDADSIFKSSIPATGLVTLSVVTPSNEHLLVDSMIASYKDVKKTFPVPEKISSATKTYIGVVIDGDHIKISCSQPMKSANYLIVCQGQIVESGREEFSSEKKEACITTKVNRGKFDGPTNTIVVFAFIGANNEIVVASTTYKVKRTLSNFLNIKLYKSKVETGYSVTISLETNPNSVVALRGVDQSSLKNDRNIISNRIEGILENFMEGIIRHKMLSDSLALRILDDVGIVIFTNCYFEEASFKPLKNAMQALVDDIGTTVRPVEESKVGLVRERFPESWIWETINASNKTLEIYKKVPDGVIGSWILTGFSLNPNLGIGVSLNPQFLETFRPFLISFDLPYSVTVGSVFALKILLHNYINQEISGVIVFKNLKKEFKFVESLREIEDIKTSLEKHFKILPLEHVSLTFTISVFTIGDIKLEIEGKTLTASDLVSKMLKVVPQGIKQELNKAVLLDVRSEDRINISVILSDEMRATAVKFSVVGDLFGTTITNLDKLIQQPFGCGEQNMLSLVPNIIILDYFKASGSLTPSVEGTVTNFLEIGYQRELTYRNPDGSFSVCGVSDSSGSTWLTAFVVRSFMYARKYITIDQKTITESLEYLARLQKSNGEFIEKGQLIRSDIQGRPNSKMALTAYVVLSFLEAKELGLSSKYNSVVRFALEYLSDAIIDAEDPFTVILICYTFHVAGHDKKDYAFKKVKNLARHDSQNEYTYWSITNETVFKKLNNPISIGLTNISIEHPPISVEMTAYSLLTFVMRHNIAESVPIVKWLLAQRNSNGGFLSTQDTIIGLAALAKFATMTKPSANFEVFVSLEYSHRFQHFTVSRENEMVVQEYILPSDAQCVFITASGKGMALAQLSWDFYVTESSQNSPFNVTAQFKQSEEYPGKYFIHICSALIMAAGTETNVVVMEVNLPSGYILESRKLPELLQSDKIMRFEEENDHTKLNIYFTSLTNSEICVDIATLRMFNVGNISLSAGIITYDYYDTTWKSTSFIQSPSFLLCKMCASDDQMCDESLQC